MAICSSVILEMKNISKRFPGVQALDNVNFSLREGEVHVLMGANGAGKSTLMKILSGAYPQDSGEIFLHGKRVEINSARHAQEQGIAVIHQYFSQVPHLTVAENVFLGREKRNFGFINYKELYAETEKILKVIGLNINVKTKVIDLSVSNRQMAEIAKALSFNSRILIMDEPTSSLTKNETLRLFEIIKSLTAQGVGIVYISHRIEELKNIGDLVTVMKDGRVVGTEDIQKIQMSHLVKMMVGKNVDYDNKKNKNPGEAVENEVALRVEKLNMPGKLFDINFSLYKSEILGLYGLMGSGRTEIARALFGVDKITSGQIFINDKLVEINSPSEAINKGLGFLTEDRMVSGLALCMGVGQNITLPSLRDLMKCKMLIDLKKEKTIVEKMISDLNIKTSSQSVPVHDLSGGNQQKVVFAKWILANSKILILDDPTQGIDVGAIEEVQRMILEITKKMNKSVLYISSELNELIQLCDRILVLKEGRLISEISGKDATKENVMSAALVEGNV